MKPIIVWFHQDLRLSDNAALYHAVASGKPLILLYILEENPNTEWQIGGAQRWCYLLTMCMGQRYRK